jgi:hypothetical protein
VRHFDTLDDDQIAPSSDPDPAWPLVMPEQHHVAPETIQAVSIIPILMSLQGSAGTRGTLTAKALIKVLQFHRKKRLICGTTGITVVQCPGRTTPYSLFHLGTDEQSKGAFRLNTGRRTPVARYPCR